MQYKLSARALDDLRQIADFTTDYFGSAQAVVYIAALEHTFELLAQSPMMGAPWDKEAGIRRFVYRAHLIYYKIDEDGDPLILTIYHGSRPVPGPADIL